MSSQVTELPLDSSRYILAQIDKKNVAFSEDIVVEIVSLDWSAILRLPFYDVRVLGVAHYQGTLMPLCMLMGLHAAPIASEKETLTAIRLNEGSGNPGGVGIVVNKILGQVKASQFKDESNIHVFSHDDVPDAIWEIQR